MKIAFLIHNAYEIGGTIRTVVNLANELSGRHEVEVASVFRHREEPRFRLDPRVRLTPLVDLRADREAGHVAETGASRLFPACEGRYPQYSKLTDRRITAWFAGVDAEVVIGTRPGLNVMLARYGPRRAARIGQEHLTLQGHRAPLRARLRSSYRLLDALVTVTEADASAYRSRMPFLRVVAVPNSVPAPRVPLSDGTSKVVVAGRFTPGKRFDRLVDAFATVVRERPDWKLKIYGGGRTLETIRQRIAHHSLHDSVLLMGMHASMEQAWADASIAAVSSVEESFGMTIVEAMRCGVPVVSTDCPLGPREIIRHGRDGLLVPVDDTEALAEALLRLVGDDQQRLLMARSARERGSEFDPAVVAHRHEALLQELVHCRRSAPMDRGLRRRLTSTRTAVCCGIAEYTFRAARRVKRTVSRLRLK
ncbi:glycosyltransferase family 4 protein [Streptomyces sp. NPDC015492]|uniref:glycosyltransferase family 4 protein n=1 Tax=Streptomyces sp. NPDC015492 TaxID=3364958 RepID=UPI0036FC24D2